MQLQPIASNMTQLDLSDGTSVLFSYKTPVACLSDNGYYRTSKKWSVTTSRHINKWLGGVLAKEQLVPSKYAKEAIKKYNIDPEKPIPTKL